MTFHRCVVDTCFEPTRHRYKVEIDSIYRIDRTYINICYWFYFLKRYFYLRCYINNLFSGRKMKNV